MHTFYIEGVPHWTKLILIWLLTIIKSLRIFEPFEKIVIAEGIDHSDTQIIRIELLTVDLQPLFITYITCYRHKIHPPYPDIVLEIIHPVEISPLFDVRQLDKFTHIIISLHQTERPGIFRPTSDIYIERCGMSVS